jgi:hypothetical protein
MKRRWNWSLWAGFLLVLAGLLSYVPVFAHFPVTRDFPWVNLLMFAAGGALLVAGLMRAYRQPQLYRGRITGPVLAVLSVLGIGFFCYGLFYVARQLPESAAAPRVGQRAPDFTLPDHDGNPLALADLLEKSNAALLIFYRGYW